MGGMRIEKCIRCGGQTLVFGAELAICKHCEQLGDKTTTKKTKKPNTNDENTRKRA